MADRSIDILERFRTRYGKDIDLTLRPAYRDLLSKLGEPQDSIPSVFHIAGTNGKGSTCAFLRATLEAAGYTVNVYTSPHLVTVYERIRLQERLISEDELAETLLLCERYAEPQGVSYFEAMTAAAFVAFQRNPADVTILETGLGGRLDATNVVRTPAATLISRLSYDHREYLGDTIEQIAREKAGIMRARVPCFVAPQTNASALQTLRTAGASLEAPITVGGEDWQVSERDDGFEFRDHRRHYALPMPALLGRHQLDNAGNAIAALSVLAKPPTVDDLREGMRRVSWPARLQKLKTESFDAPLSPSALPAGSEIWLDGGHNDSAGEVLARQILTWQRDDGTLSKPLYVILGMLTTKRMDEFVGPFAVYVSHLWTVPVPNEPLGTPPAELRAQAVKLGIKNVETATAVRDAFEHIRANSPRTAIRILICGSLYLAGAVLGEI